MANKPISRKARIAASKISQRPDFNRGNQLRRDTDDMKGLSVSIKDVDAAIMYYFNEVIRPSVNENKEVVKVPVMYASPERCVNIQKRGFMRDKKQQIVCPIIVFRRTGIQKNDNIPVDKMDANRPQNFVTMRQRYSRENRYDQFSRQIGLQPTEEFYNVLVPDYITLNYEFTIWTSYIEQMNRIVERVNYTDGAYWGEPGKMRFRSNIESFSDASEMDAGERLVKTNFSVIMYGYILPDEFNKVATTKKQLTPKRLVFGMDTDKTTEQFAQIQPDGSLRPLGQKQKTSIPQVTHFGVKTSKSFTLNAGNSIVLSNDGVSFNGSETVIHGISTIQPITKTSNVVFNNLTTNILKVGDTTFNAEAYVGNLGITGSMSITGNMEVGGNANFDGTVTAREFHTRVVSASIVAQSGSTKFGDTIDDRHEFTGSMSISGSISLNNRTIFEISNDPSLGDASENALVTEHAVKTYGNTLSANVAAEQTYLRKNFYKMSNLITPPSTASFTAVTASAPDTLSSTNENDFLFFVNGQYMEHDALTIQQANATTFLLKVDNSSIGYDLETDDEIVALGKFNS